MLLNYSEVGPYVYDESREKYDVKFSEDGNTVSFREKKIFTFNQKLSGKLKQTDKITIVQPVYVC